MLSSDRERGKFILITTSILFLYYTVWVLGLPFIDDSRLQSLFYSHDVALMVPAVISFCFIGGLVVFTCYHLSPLMFASKKDN